ncbi:endonuclease [Yinghuangia sp. YIM S10712]|uniref:endonuclease n=1 Tax=Yinghuangia sp. YIM S10712 TaxID=3436930 RepID=UPI003F53C81C
MVTTVTPGAAPAATEYLAQMGETQSRYEARAAAREETRRTLDRRGVLHADEPERVTRRLARLGVDWSLATAMERTPPSASTGRSFGTALAPDSFGADVLGLERLMGRNDLIDVGFLEAGYLASRSVGRITVRGAGAHFGTGFMVSPSLLLTNNHVLRDEDEAARGFIEFNLQAGTDGRPLPPVAFTLEPARFFTTDVALDFTLVAVAPGSADGIELASFGHVPLIELPGKVIIGELVNIIQHPNGEPKQLALRENRVVDMLDDFLHYETDTAPGSSGSPVFNDQWEVVALHHSGVPLTNDQGRLLCTDGTVWTPDMGEQRLAWKANEGVRTSRILAALSTHPLTGSAADLRAELFATAPQAPVPGAVPAAPTAAPSGPTIPQSAPAVQAPGPAGPAPGTAAGTAPPAPAAAAYDGVVRMQIPVRIDVSVSAAATSAVTYDGATPTAPAAPPVTAPGAAAPSVEADVNAALVDLQVGQGRAYYDHAADRAARETYYAQISGATGSTLRRMLTALLENTHQRRPAYKPMRLVYPWVDLHPDGRLRSIYSGKTFTAEELIRADAAVESARIGHWQEFLRRESTPTPDAIERELESLEAALPFNCEHVVPQSWFAKAEPMRGDLHHLFACEAGCNSFRGNIPYIDFEDPEEAVRTDCGRRESQGFEPAAGKGAVARATMYFLLRYPRLVGDTAREFPAERLGLLRAWHETDPVSDHERHRNFAVAEIQGNRNPLIDNPAWADAIDFADVWP